MKTLKLLACAALAGAAFTSAAAAQSERDQEALEALEARYERTGETRSCVSLTRLDQIRPVTDEIWLFIMRGGDTYLNEVGRGCNGAASPFTFLTYEVPGSQLCRNEIVRVVEQSTPRFTRGSCGLGEFQALRPREQAEDGSGS